MTSLRWFGITTFSTCLLVATFGACSSDDTVADYDDSSVGTSSGKAGSSSGKTGSSSGGETSSSGGSSSSSGANGSSSGGSSGVVDAGPACVEGGEAALDGGSFCGSYQFRKPEVYYAPVDADAGATWTGGTIVEGTYDLVKVEYNAAQGGWFRETIVFDCNGRFTRIRQSRLTADGSTGPVVQRSGEYRVNGASISFIADCTYENGTDIGPQDNNNIPFDVATGPNGRPAFRYGASGIRLTLEQQ